MPREKGIIQLQRDQLRNKAMKASVPVPPFKHQPTLKHHTILDDLLIHRMYEDLEVIVEMKQEALAQAT